MENLQAAHNIVGTTISCPLVVFTDRYFQYCKSISCKTSINPDKQKILNAHNSIDLGLSQRDVKSGCFMINSPINKSSKRTGESMKFWGGEVGINRPSSHS